MWPQDLIPSPSRMRNPGARSRNPRHSFFRHKAVNLEGLCRHKSRCRNGSCPSSWSVARRYRWDHCRKCSCYPVWGNVSVTLDWSLYLQVISQMKAKQNAPLYLETTDEWPCCRHRPRSSQSKGSKRVEHLLFHLPANSLTYYLNWSPKLFQVSSPSSEWSLHPVCLLRRHLSCLLGHSHPVCTWI